MSFPEFLLLPQRACGEEAIKARRGKETKMKNKGVYAFILFLFFSLEIAGQAQTRFRNIVNTPFATRASGPLGAIIVPHQKGAPVPANWQGVQTYRQHNPQLLRRAVASYRRIERLRLTRRRAEIALRFPRTLVRTLDGVFVQPDWQRAKELAAKQAQQRRLSRRSLFLAAPTIQPGTIGSPANELSFSFEGWSAADEAALRAYLNTAYPKAKQIYGPPAFNLNVKIIRDSTLQNIQGGIYDVSTNEIRIPPLSGNFPEDTYVLLMLVLNAFHDDAIFYYDAWEQGFIGAAAYVIQTQPGVSPGYDPVDPGPFYCLSVYEAENQPELGNCTFYPPSGATNMLVWRIAMARAAWLKCWIENPQFFAQFNQAYYAQYTPQLAGDIPSLKEIAAAIVPTVEGIPFADWYEQQYVLDTSVRVGDKLYTWNIPLPESVVLICELYKTLADGDEQPFGGQARTIYWNYERNIQLYSEAGNVINIPATGETPGEGFLLPAFYNIGGPQRIAVQIDVAGLRREYIYPYGMRGFEINENNLYGAIIGEDSGTIDVVGGRGLTGVAVSRGVWGDRLTTGLLSPMQIQLTFKSNSGATFTRKANIGWDSYICFLRAGQLVNVSHTFRWGQNGLHLLSLPVQPVSANLPEIFNTPAGRLLLAWWDPYLPGENKYRLWPGFVFRSPGQAYWWRVLQDTTLNIQGILPPSNQPYEVPLGPGWNLVGSPRLNSVALSHLQVQQGENPPVSWAEAVAQRLMQNSLFSYDQSAGYLAQTTLEPWQGYWMRCLAPNGVILIFPAEQ